MTARRDSTAPRRRRPVTEGTARDLTHAHQRMGSDELLEAMQKLVRLPPVDPIVLCFLAYTADEGRTAVGITPNHIVLSRAAPRPRPVSFIGRLRGQRPATSDVPVGEATVVDLADVGTAESQGANRLVITFGDGSSRILVPLGSMTAEIAADAIERVRTGYPPSIGSATMRDDGTLVLQLRAEGPGGVVGDALKVYPPDDEDYQRQLEHAGGLVPGESKPIPPWVDEDD